MDIANYLRDSMEFQIISHVTLSNRHKMLVPLVLINQTKNKIKKPFGYETTFEKNIHERTESPVFSINEAISEIKENLKKDTSLADHSNLFKKEMDQFILKHLPKDIQDDHNEQSLKVLNEETIRMEKKKANIEDKQIGFKSYVNLDQRDANVKKGYMKNVKTEFALENKNDLIDKILDKGKQDADLKRKNNRVSTSGGMRNQEIEEKNQISESKTQKASVNDKHNVSDLASLRRSIVGRRDSVNCEKVSMEHSTASNLLGLQATSNSKLINETIEGKVCRTEIEYVDTEGKFIHGVDTEETKRGIEFIEMKTKDNVGGDEKNEDDLSSQGHEEISDDRSKDLDANQSIDQEEI